MLLKAGDKSGSWFARFPRNDKLCCNYEPHVLLDNLGNIDWRPCIDFDAIKDYIAKYAVKAPKSTKRLAEVLAAAVDEVTKYEAEGEGIDFLRKVLNKVFSKTVGDRDYGLFEAVHVGLRLPLVFALAECVSLNTSGARVLRTGGAVSNVDEDAPLTWDSKLDKFDKRLELLQKAQAKNSCDIDVSEFKDVSLYEFYFKFGQAFGKLCRWKVPPVLMVTPGFSSDCACVTHERHAQADLS